MNLKKLSKVTDNSSTLVFFDRVGNPTCYTEDNEHIYSFDGRTLGFINQESLFDYNGNHIGWIQNGWISDKLGKYLLFSDKSKGGPVKPVKRWIPTKGVKHIKPVPRAKVVGQVPPIFTPNWSDILAEEIFK